MKKVLLFILLIVLSSNVFIQGINYSVTLANPEAPINNQIVNAEWDDITHLTVKGLLSKTNLVLIGTLPNLEYLDLINSTIGEMVSNNFVPTNTIPSNIFSNNKGVYPKLHTFILPASLKTIADKAFFECKTLENVNFSACLELDSIGNYAFKGTALKSINLKNTKLQSIANFAFYECNYLSSITLPSSIVKIGIKSFACLEQTVNARIINFHELINLQEIGNSAFNDNRFMDGEVDLSRCHNLKSIGRNSFVRCNDLTTSKFPPSLESVGQMCFYDTQMEKIDLSNTKIETINHSLFNSSSCKVKNIALPQTIKQFSLEGLNQNLETLMCLAPTPPTLSNGEEINKSKCKLFILKGTEHKYRNAPIWKEFFEGDNNIYAIAPDGKVEEIAKVEISIESNQVQVSGLNNGELISLYNTIGKKIYSSKASNSNFQLTVPNSGIYILKIGKTSHKILVKSQDRS